MDPQIRSIRPQSYRDLIAKALDQGWTYKSSPGRHIQLIPPPDAPGAELGPVWAASSSSDWRGERNLRAQLRKRGLIC